MLEFIQSLHFESIILIDEAEKTFREEQEVLLKMIDGVYNDMRKLYILTTNKLLIDENLLGRPGASVTLKSDSTLNILKAKYRMQIISFDSLDVKSHQEVKDYIKDHLVYNESVADWLR